MPFVFGNSFDSLANQRQALNRFQFDVASRNEANRLASQEASARLGLSAQAQADEVAARNASFDFSAQQAAANLAAKAANNADVNNRLSQKFAIDTEINRANAAQKESERRRAAAIDQRDFNFRTQGRAQDVKVQASKDLKEFMEAVAPSNPSNLPVINNRDDAKAAASALPPPEAERALAFYDNQVIRQTEDAYSLSGLARNLNSNLKLEAAREENSETSLGNLAAKIIGKDNRLMFDGENIVPNRFINPSLSGDPTEPIALKPEALEALFGGGFMFNQSPDPRVGGVDTNFMRLGR